MKRVICLFVGHDPIQWPSWSHAGHGAFQRVAWCRRCKKQLVENDPA